jgi:hypothetical protein
LTIRDSAVIFAEGVDFLVDVSLRSLRDFDSLSGREMCVVTVEDDLVARAGCEGAFINFVRAGRVVVVFGVWPTVECLVDVATPLFISDGPWCSEGIKFSLSSVPSPSAVGGAIVTKS